MKDYIFTFGAGTPLGKSFVRIAAHTAELARQKMGLHYGRQWAFQYESEEEAGVERWGLTEVPLGTPNT